MSDSREYCFSLTNPYRLNNEYKVLSIKVLKKIRYFLVEPTNYMWCFDTKPNDKCVAQCVQKLVFTLKK